MQLTNNSNLPLPLVEAVRRDDYDRGAADYSISELLTPPRIRALRDTYAADLVEDASDRMYSLFGRLIHQLLASTGAGNDLREQRFFAPLDGMTLSGQLDYMCLEKAALSDYKFVSVWKIKDGLPREYEEQINAYSWLLRRNGRCVKSAQIVAILRDWSKMQAKRDPSYPQQGVALLPVPLWEDAAIEEFLRSRLEAHVAANYELPLCTDEDRWIRSSAAVMKRGRKTAVKRFPNAEAAQLWLSQQSDASQLYVESRGGEPTRCLEYCPVAAFCTQHADYLAGQQSTNPNLWE